MLYLNASGLLKKDHIIKSENLEYGPEARNSTYAKAIFKLNDNDKGKVLTTLLYLFFEMRAPEEKKREIWKRLQEAIEKGEKVSSDQKT